jgi:ElaB/YqjD/DUF883 family membrane-anchored ribosome-binding protein
MSKKPEKKLTAVDRKKVESALGNMEKKLLENYRSAVTASGKSWSKESQKVKKKIAAAKKKVEGNIKKNPAAAVTVAAVLGAIAGAVIMSKLKKK